MDFTHPGILRAEREGSPVSKPQRAELLCDCGELVTKLYECDFCHKRYCFCCYFGAAEEVNGGLNVRDTGWTCCYACAENPKIQLEILSDAKRLAESKLQRAEKRHQAIIDEIAAEIDGINQVAQGFVGQKRKGFFLHSSFTS